MRNLKRALSLTLASVMLLGMMVIGTSAVSYSDADGITNAEAVDVMNASEIMLGSGGKFMPNQTVTRAQMAIIVIKMLYGSDMNVKQFEGETNFTDVPANAYYSGYVNLASQLGIINGYGNGKFGPAAPVTTAQAALMLTKALGYFKDNSELGDSWILSAITKATEIGLFGDLKLDRNAGLRRDDVAEMTFNAITEATPVAKNDFFGYYTVGASLTDGVLRGEDDFTKTLAYKIHDLNTAPKANHGEQGHVWINRLSNAVLSDFYSTDNVLGTSTDGTVISKLTNRTDSKFKAELDTADAKYAFYYNGEKLPVVASSGSGTLSKSVVDSKTQYLYLYDGQVRVATSTSYNTSSDKVYSASDSTGGVRKGVVVTFRDIKENDGTYDGKAEIVTIVEKTVTKLSRDAVTETSGATTTLKYAVGVVDTNVPVEQIHGYEGLVKDDVIMSVALAGGHDNLTHYYIEKADSVEGDVTAIRATTTDGVTRDKYTLSGGTTTYEESGLVNAGKGIVTSDAKLGAKVAFYLDNGGYVIYTKLLDAADDNYAVVLDYDPKTMEGQKTKLLFTDGTTATVTAEYKVGSDTKTMIETVGDASKQVAVAKAGATSLVQYSIEGGVYKLKAVPNATATEMGKVTVTQVKRNTATVGSSLYANDQTVFVLRDDTSAKAISTYTGIGNVADVTAGTFLAVGKGASVSYIFVLGATSSISSTDIFYVTEPKHDLSNTYKSDGSVDKNLATYNVVMNGEVKKLTGLKDTMEAAITTTGAYRVSSYDSEGYVSGLARVPDATPDTYYEGTLDYTDAKWAKSFDGKTVTYDGGGAVVDEKTTWVRVNKDGVASAGSESDLLATTTSSEKFTPVIVVYRVDNGARTGLADVVFVFNGSSTEANGQKVVVAAPVIGTQPTAPAASQVDGTLGGTMTVVASATNTLTYQWYVNGVAATAGNYNTGTYTLNTTDMTKPGSYKVYAVATTTDGSSTTTTKSNEITVNVVPKTPVSNAITGAHTGGDGSDQCVLAFALTGSAGYYTSAAGTVEYKLYKGSSATAMTGVTFDTATSGTVKAILTDKTAHFVADSYYLEVTVNGQTAKSAAITVTAHG